MELLEHYMHLLFFSGFLGSGKTSLVLRVVEHVLGKSLKIAILVNEIGEVGIDNQLMRQLDLNVWELVNGCICCTLSTDLVRTLQELDTGYNPDLVIIEPSGVADPKSIQSAMPYYKGTPFESLNTVSVLDPLRVEMLITVMTPLITSQIKNADCILISKCDQATSEQIGKAYQISAECNPDAKVLEYGPDTPMEILMKEAAPWMN
jgi:G3E family GTPase